MKNPVKSQTVRFKMMTQVVLYLFAALPILGVTSLRYDGYQVYETVADDNIQMEALLALEQSGMFDFWTDLRFDRLIDIMAAPDKVNQLVDFLTINGIPHRLKISNVQQLIDQQHSSIKRGPYSLRYNLTWDNYYRYDDIREFSYSLAASYPNLVTVSSVGRSFENREMILIKVSSRSSGTKNAIFVDSGIHACEWISPATGTYIIRELVENYVNQPQYVKDVDWFFMPLVNPDGYEFSHTDSRLWRKNRRPNDKINSTCIGNDINRNFDFHFGSDSGGSSDDPCRPTYNGGEAFSESESRALRDAILSVANRTKVYLTLHSYGQHWLTPWGYTNELPDDYDQLAALGNEAVAALTAMYGTEYDVGPSGSLLYTNSGPSDDWAKGAAGIAYSYTIELRDQGPVYGFLLPADQIVPSGIETWEAFKVVANAVSKMTY